MATWLGGLLMALGLISVLGSSRIVREAVRSLSNANLFRRTDQDSNSFAMRLE